MKFTAKTFSFFAIFCLIIIAVVAQAPSDTPTLTSSPSTTDYVDTGIPTSPTATAESTSPSPSPSSSSSGLPKLVKTFLIGFGAVNGAMILIGVPIFIYYRNKKKRRGDKAHIVETAGSA
ncbi:hypothetical protein Glove_421g136 [Diversispora epigaea]|uniref:Mid2 domain-containing protein n=1 Tax=Diversispora epigaea TaxID=1348612 RepID=A0A397H3E9_9GLOM|nr:hypothetical protein Glove_421g136 [Diversispora epigaea]